MSFDSKTMTKGKGMLNFNRANHIKGRAGRKKVVPATRPETTRTDLVPDWFNRNTITGEVIFEARRKRKGTYADPDKMMHTNIYTKLENERT
jgi:hypothetical protein